MISTDLTNCDDHNCNSRESLREVEKVNYIDQITDQDISNLRNNLAKVEETIESMNNLIDNITIKLIQANQLRESISNIINHLTNNSDNNQ